MTAQLESSLEQFFRKRVRLLGGITEKLAPTTAGMPDRMVLIHGRIYLVELKTETGSVSAVQKVWHDKARARGIKVHVLRGQDGVLEWLKMITDYAGGSRRARKAVSS